MKDTDQKSEEVTKLLSERPNWIIRWGTLIVFVILILSFISSFFISYPERITSSVIIEQFRKNPSNEECSEINLIVPGNIYKKLKKGQIVTISPDKHYDRELLSFQGVVKNTSIGKDGKYNAIILIYEEGHKLSLDNVKDKGIAAYISFTGDKIPVIEKILYKKNLNVDE
jgi:hypothetical protein